MSTVNGVGAGHETGGAQSTNSSMMLGQEDFLELMVAQMRNQDPTNPADSSTFMSQLAQFATVDGIQKLQATAFSLNESVRTNQAVTAASLMGKSVLVPSEVGIIADASGVAGAVAVPRGVTDVVVSIYDKSENLVRQLTLGDPAAGLVDFHWDGKDGDGNALPPGSYWIEADGLVEDEGRETLGTLVVAPVTSVTLGADGAGPLLNMGDYGSAGLNDVWRIL